MFMATSIGSLVALLTVVPMVAIPPFWWLRTTLALPTVSNTCCDLNSNSNAPMAG